MNGLVIRLIFIISLLALLISQTAVAAIVSDPCGGPSALLNLVNRPTVGDSACVVPYQHAVVETGYQYFQLSHSGGDGYTYPQAVLRIGLPLDNEFVLLLPTYIHQSLNSVSGSTYTSLGIKHEVGYNAKWLGSVETLFVLPNGSSAYGSNDVGAAINGIIMYTFNPQLSATFMMGVVTQTEPSLLGGQRYTTLNPDLVVAYALKDNLNIYGEAFGLTSPGPNEGFASVMDVGILYLLTPNLEVDFVAGRRISGNYFEINRFIGAGFSVLF